MMEHTVRLFYSAGDLGAAFGTGGKFRAVLAGMIGLVPPTDCETAGVMASGVSVNVSASVRDLHQH